MIVRVRHNVDGRADQRERELTAYLVVGDSDAAHRLAARTDTIEELVPVLLRHASRVDLTTPRPSLPPRVAAFWWWLLRLPVADRVALVTFSRHGWAYDDLDPLLAQAARVLGSGLGQRQAAEALAVAFDAVLPAVRVPPVRRAARPTVARRRAGAGVGLAATLLAVAAALATAGPATAPPAGPPTQALPRPAARPIANYESSAVVPGAQWDLPTRGGHRRSAPPWLR